MAAQDRAALYALVDSTFPDNTAGQISPEDLRAVTDAIIESGFILEDDSDTGKTTPVDADTLVLRDSAAANAPKALTWSNAKAGIWSALGALINGGTGKTTPVDADTLALSDSAASNASKKLTWANLKAALFLDEDDMASDSATQGATQQSVKAYVDAMEPGLAKAWCIAGISGNILASHNVSGVVDGGTGIITFTIDSDFASANWAAPMNAVATASGATVYGAHPTAIAAGSLACVCEAGNNGNNFDPDSWHFAGFGALA